MNRYAKNPALPLVMFKAGRDIYEAGIVEVVELDGNIYEAWTYDSPDAIIPDETNVEDLPMRWFRTLVAMAHSFRWDYASPEAPAPELLPR